MPEISVIVPVYNTAKYLEQCLRSIATQTFGNFEAVVVDDGSTDSSLSIAQSFAENDSRFKVFEQKNGGPSKARNTGLKHASGKWIVFVDSDDVAAPSMLHDLLFAAKACKTKVACGRTRSFRGTLHHGDILPTSKTRPHTITAEKAIERSLYQKNFPDYSLWNKIFHVDLWKKRKLKEGTFFEDLISVISIFNEIDRVALVNRTLYYYRKHPESALANQGGEKTAVLLDICEGLCKEANEKNASMDKKTAERLLKAAESSLLSAGFSILMRTPDTEEFSEYRSRAWYWINEFRLQCLLDCKSRIRNKVAALCSFGGMKFLELVMKRFG
jgi:glycosyltransferase involved in cell wall biosynthesis